jgi:uncharacterized membrane protein (UPF0127 family)
MIATFTKTRQTRVLYIFSIIAIGALLLVLFLRSRQAVAPVLNTQKSYDAIVTIGSVDIPVTIADSPQEQEQGLSGTDSLDEGSGELFVFNTVGKYGFWMKDMNYPLDLIWIDEKLNIVAISKDISPNTYPTIFNPPTDVKYVLEVNAGFSTKHGITENQLIKISSNLSF